MACLTKDDARILIGIINSSNFKGDGVKIVAGLISKLEEIADGKCEEKA